MTSRQRRWQIKQQEMGKCRRCGKDRDHYKNYCDGCAKKEIAAQRRRLGHKPWEKGGRGRIPFVE